MRVLEEDGTPATVDSDLVAVRLKKLLAATRMEPVEGGESPVGVTVNYNVALTGFRGRRVTVRWSLHRVPTGKQVPLEWLKNEPIHWLEGQAEKDTASDSFWIPIPKIGGPFFVRLGIYNGNTRLDYKDSDSFP
jgi:hypothetical protein